MLFKLMTNWLECISFKVLFRTIRYLLAMIIQLILTKIWNPLLSVSITIRWLLVRPNQKMGTMWKWYGILIWKTILLSRQRIFVIFFFTVRSTWTVFVCSAQHTDAILLFCETNIVLLSSKFFVRSWFSLGRICDPTVKNQRICNPHLHFPEKSLSLRQNDVILWN